jgi:hypothetical protein
MKREHGLHNKKLCDKLYLSEPVEFNDWVVTTAFYSSIHFLDHALFPCKYESQTFTNINEAHRRIKANSKHQTRAILIGKLMPKHKADYDFLISESQNARYSNYNVNPAISKRAYFILDKIKDSYDKEKSNIVIE